MQENKPTIGLCPYHKYFDRHCSWCKAELTMTAMSKDIEALHENMGFVRVKQNINHSLCSCAACLVRAPHPYHGCECQPYPEDNLKFSAHGDTGIYVKENFVLRDPQWRDVVQMFKDWWTNTPRKFLEPSVAVAVSGKQITFSDEPSECPNCGRIVGAHICRIQKRV